VELRHWPAQLRHLRDRGRFPWRGQAHLVQLGGPEGDGEADQLHHRGHPASSWCTADWPSSRGTRTRWTTGHLRARKEHRWPHPPPGAAAPGSWTPPKRLEFRLLGLIDEAPAW